MTNPLTAPITPEEYALIKDMPPTVAAGFLLRRREAALQEDIKSSIEKAMS